jgi:exodeoxyribonuclease VII large subunit
MERCEAILARRMARCAQRVDELDTAGRRRISLLLGRLGKQTTALDARLRECDPRARLRSHRRRLAELDMRLVQGSPRTLIAGHHQRVETARNALSHTAVALVSRQNARFGRAAAALDQLSPVRILDRGYSIVENEQGRILRDSGEVSIGEAIRIRLAKGRIGARVENQN